jgi:1,4-alpha-glucan branching enzyme
LPIFCNATATTLIASSLETLTTAAGEPGWSEINLNTLGLEDGDHKYEFIKDGAVDTPIAGLYAAHITRSSGCRGIFQIRNG